MRRFRRQRERATDQQRAREPNAGVDAQYQPRCDGGATGDADNEDRDDGAEGVRGGAQDLDEQTRPDDLQRQRRESTDTQRHRGEPWVGGLWST